MLFDYYQVAILMEQWQCGAVMITACSVPLLLTTLYTEQPGTLMWPMSSLVWGADSSSG